MSEGEFEYTIQCHIRAPPVVIDAPWPVTTAWRPRQNGVPVPPPRFDSGGCVMVVEGSISAGKSTLCQSILAHAEQLFGAGVHVDVLLESVDQTFLEAYIADKRRWAFDFQVYMARNRVETMRRAEQLAARGHIVIVDRGLPGDLTFARMHRTQGNFSDVEWSIYASVMRDAYPQFLPVSLFDGAGTDSGASTHATSAMMHMTNYSSSARAAAHKADVCILYLKTTPECALRRLKQRADEAEVAGYSLDYFRQLCAAYDHTIDAFRRSGHTRVAVYDHERDVTLEPASGLLSLDDTRRIVAPCFPVAH